MPIADALNQDADTGRRRSPGQDRGKRLWFAGLSAVALLAAHPAAAAAPQLLHLPAGPLDQALLALAAQSHEQLLFPRDVTADKRVPALDGTYTTEAALQRLLTGTGLTARQAGAGVYVLRPAGATPAPEVQPAAEGGAPPRPFVADPPGGSGGPSGPGPTAIGDPAAVAPASEVSALTITGSHIRGAGAGASPLLNLDAAALQATNQPTLAAALNTLPQAFSGESNEATVTTRAARLANNLTFATGVNLRGLGPNATLVLFDGRRFAGAGNNGDFTDVSMIPSIAVSRVEILLDGASALYGSDAVAGVVNVRLRRDLEGGELRLRGAVSTQGGADDGQVGLVLGHGWSGGGALVAYEGFARGALHARSRTATASADLRPFGGSDFRSPNAFPGNIVAVNPATGVSGPIYGVPPGQPGTGLTPASFTAGQINLQSPQAGMDILPDQRRQSVFASVHQALGAALEISGEAAVSDRTATAHTAPATTSFAVSRANPFFVSPNGAASNTLQYSFAGEIGAPPIRETARTGSASLGAHLVLPAGWAADGYGAWARETDHASATGQLNSLILAEALGNSADNPATPYSAARDGFFNPYTGQAANRPAVIAALSSGFTRTDTRSQVASLDLQADGPLLRLPGGPLKLAMGGNLRRETFARGGLSYLSTATPTPQAALSGRRTVSALFAEALVPLAGPDTARPLLQGLELSLSGRFERYSDFGDTTNPKVGVVWTPVTDLKLRASYGRSFRAPGLGDLNSAQIDQALSFPAGGTTRALSLNMAGGNPDLRPETARTWSAGFDYAPARVAGLRLSASWFDTTFTNRIDRPVFQNLAGALTDPRFGPFVRRISPATNPADLALINSLLALPAADGVRGLNPPTAYGAIVDSRAVNTGQLAVKGLDLTALYSRGVLDGRLTAGLNATRLFTYAQALTPAAPRFDFVGVATWPAQLRARATLDWRRGPVALGAALNHTSAFHDSAGARVRAQDTLDLSAEVSGTRGALRDTRLRLSVRNAFDRAPPFYNNPFGFAFDPANADVIGRVVALELTRSW